MTINLLTAEQVAEICGVNIRKAYEIMDEAGAINLGTAAKKNRRITADDLNHYLMNRKETPAVQQEKRKPGRPKGSTNAEMPLYRIGKDGKRHGLKYYEVFGREAKKDGSMAAPAAI